MPTDAERLKANLATLAGQVTRTEQAQARVNRLAVNGHRDNRARIDTLDGRVTTVETGFADLSGLVVRQGQQHDMLRDAHETTATYVDRHTMQIETHDNWFVAVFDRLGERVDWAMVMIIAFVCGLISVPFWYFFVFEQYGLAKHFADPKNQLIVDIPSDPGRMWLVSIACGVVVMFITAFVLSFIMNRSQNRANAQAQANAQRQAAPAPQPQLPPPPAQPAPAPQGAGTQPQPVV